MDPLELSKSAICTQCNQSIINYPIQFCRKQFLNPSIKARSISENLLSGNSKLDEFIKETQSNSKHCDDFIEWIPLSYLKNIEPLEERGNSMVYRGTWNLFASINIALKAIRDSNNIDENILNEFKIHHKCRSQDVIPFYGITKAPKRDEYAMVIRHAEYGDLRKYICKFFPDLTWTDKAEILIKLSRALNSLHQMNILHKDFHCKNILVDKDNKVFISDFGLCQPLDSKTVSNSIQGVLPYIAPEVLRGKQYTKQSEVYSLSMIMWELTSRKPPFLNCDHDLDLACAVILGRRPEIVQGTPGFYAEIMHQCWNSDPSERPDASLLPKKFEEMMEKCRVVDNNAYSLPQSMAVSTETISIKPGYETEIPSTCSSESKEKISITNEDNSIVNSINHQLEDNTIPTEEGKKEKRKREDDYEGVDIDNTSNGKRKRERDNIDSLELDFLKSPPPPRSKRRRKINLVADIVRKSGIMRMSLHLDNYASNTSNTYKKDYDYLSDEIEDSRYVTQTYNFSLDDIRKRYDKPK